MFSWRFLKVWSSSLTYSVESRSHGIFCGHCLMSKFRLPNERGVNVLCLCWLSKLWCRGGDVNDKIEVFLWRCGFIPSSKYWLANVGIGDLKWSLFLLLSQCQFPSTNLWCQKGLKSRVKVRKERIKSLVLFLIINLIVVQLIFLVNKLII